MDTPKKVFWQTEIKPALDAGTPLEDIVFHLVSTARRERDKAILSLGELRSDLDTHREFWKRSRDELEEAKTLASQAHNRAQQAQRKERRRVEGRRAEDLHNARLRDAVKQILDMSGMYNASTLLDELRILVSQGQSQSSRTP